MDTDVTHLPAWLKDAVHLALADLDKPATVTWRAERDDAGVLIVGDASKRFERDAAVPANVMVGVAAWLQSELAPTCPVCPEHEHAMQARNLYDVAWWFCPASDAPIRLIGES